MSRIIRKLADQYAVLFWIFAIALFSVLLYKLPAIFLFSKNELGLAMLRFAISILMILMIREMYNGQITLGFRKKNFLKGFILIFLLTLIVFLNDFLGGYTVEVGINGIIECAIICFSIGLFEETMVRGLLIGNMMLHWKDKPHRALRSLIFSSVLFGLLHLGNLFEGEYLPMVILQTALAIFLGFALGAVYIRTKNLWPLIIMHFLIDFMVSLPGFAQPAAGEEFVRVGFEWYGQFLTLGGGNIARIILFGGQILMVVLGLILIRKSKHAEINRIWAENPAPLPEKAEN